MQIAWTPLMLIGNDIDNIFFVFSNGKLLTFLVQRLQMISAYYPPYHTHTSYPAEQPPFLLLTRDAILFFSDSCLPVLLAVSLNF